MRKIVLMTLALTFLAAAANAASIGLDFNDDSFEVRAGYGISQDQYGQTSMDGRFLYNDDEDSRLGSAGLRFMASPEAIPGLSAGAGIAGFVGRTHRGDDLANVGVGAHAEFAPPELYGAGISGKFYYAPTIFSFADSDGLWEMNVKTFYNVSPNLQLYVGYQKIRGEFEKAPDQNLDADFRIGLSANF